MLSTPPSPLRSILSPINHTAVLHQSFHTIRIECCNNNTTASSLVFVLFIANNHNIDIASMNHTTNYHTCIVLLLTVIPHHRIILYIATMINDTNTRIPHRIMIANNTTLTLPICCTSQAITISWCFRHIAYSNNHTIPHRITIANNTALPFPFCCTSVKLSIRDVRDEKLTERSTTCT